MTAINRAELVSVMDEHSDMFAAALKRRIDGWKAPLTFRITASQNVEVDLSTIPEFRKWLGKVAVDASINVAKGSQMVCMNAVTIKPDTRKIFSGKWS